MRQRMSGSGAAHFGMFGRTLIHMEENKEGGSGGGGGGGEGGDAEAEKKFSDMFNKFFHKAMGERDKRSEAKMQKTLEGFQTKIMEEMGKFFEGKTPPGGEGGEGGSGGEPKKKDELSPETRAALKRAADDAKEAKEKAEKWEREAKAAREAQKKTEERNLLVSSLNGKVKPALLDMVVDQLHSRNIVRDADDDTKILWKSPDGELLPIKDGIESWAKSDFAKEVKPPVEARGSGGRGGEGGGSHGGPFGAEQLGNLIATSIPGSRNG